jgi:hypothetical protein
MTERTREALRHMTFKASSARWIATVAACGIWAVLTWRDRISQEFNASMIALVLSWYFKDKARETE